MKRRRDLDRETKIGTKKKRSKERENEKCGKK